MSSLLAKISRKGTAKGIATGNAPGVPKRSSIVLSDIEPTKDGLLSTILGLKDSTSVLEQSMISLAEVGSSKGDLAPWWLSDPPKNSPTLDALLPAAGLFLADIRSRNAHEGDIKADVAKAVVLAAQSLSKTARVLPSDSKLANQELLLLLTGRGPLEALYKDPLVTEIFVDAYDCIRCMRLGQALETPFRFRSLENYNSFVNTLLRSLNKTDQAQQHVIEGVIEDDLRSRIKIIREHAIGKDNVKLRIALQRLQYPSLYDLIRSQTAPSSLAAWLSEVVSFGEISLLIVGAPGSGKSTFTSALLGTVGSSQRVYVVENLPEIQTSGCQLEKISLSAAGAVSTRFLEQNPNAHRIVCDDLSRETIPFLFDAIQSGYSGSIGIMNAESPKAALDKCLENLVCNSRMSENIATRKIASAIRLVLFLRLVDGKPCVEELAEVFDIDGKLALAPIVQYQGDVEGKRRWKIMSSSSEVLNRLEESGVELMSASNLAAPDIG